MDKPLRTASDPPARGLVSLLVANRDFRRLWLGNLISVCGGWFSAVAVYAMVYEHSGEPLAAGAALALRYLPGLLIGPWGGVLADRADRRTIMLAGDGLLAVLALSFLLADSPGTLWLVYPLTFASAATGFVFQAARSAWMPSLVQPAEYVLYSAAVQVNGLLFQAVGGLAGAAVIGLFGWRWAFVVNALSFLVSLLLTALVTAGGRRGAARRASGWAASFREGLRTARRTRLIAALLCLEAVFCLGLGGMITAMIHLALRVHDLGDGGTGWFYAVQGIVGAAGLLALAPRLQRADPRTRLLVIGLSCLGEGVCTALLGLPTAAWAALTLWGMAALADVVYGPTAIAALLSAAGDEIRGRVMSLWSAVATGALALSAFAAGALLDVLGHRVLLVILGTLMAAPGLAWLLALRTGAVLRPSTHDRNRTDMTVRPKTTENGHA
ncbi:MFS transporter [Actinomadura spongiicola]|uniref:MFS transporter n=1 Tax=Actinomadura spongiicola TaxID=2303421 RepID=A0A372GDB8_9ACTN|nr:MFS transporter [Actinomadura spongiicola]RFS83327.1 MFS transporter [Actinomadura spongiicola]